MTKNNVQRDIVIGITGASGAPYATRLLRCLLAAETRIHLIVTPLGRRLLLDELGIAEVTAEALVGEPNGLLTIYGYRDVGARIASGSFLTDGMIVCPCSSNTLGAIAAGTAGNLLDRAAAVTLKEARRLVLVTREMPMGRIDLLNALRLQEAGAVICPASPGFYMLPRSIDDLVDFVVGKILDLMHVPHELNTRWTDTSNTDSTGESDRGE